MSERAEPIFKILSLPASVATALLLAVALLYWAEDGEAALLDTLAAGFVGCFG